MTVFFAFTCLGAPLIQQNRHFATILNWIRLQGNVSPAQFKALLTDSKPEMQGENPPHESLEGYGIFCTECATLKKLAFVFFSQRASRVGKNISYHLMLFSQCFHFYVLEQTFVIPLDCYRNFRLRE